MIPPLFGKQVKKRFPRYGVPIWSLWPNIRFLPSIVAEKNATKNAHICSMCIKINKVGIQEVGIWRVQKRFPQYGIPIWSLWPNIRFLSSIVAEKNATKMCIYKCMLNVYKNQQIGKQEVGIWWVQKRFPRYGVSICSMCIKINKVGKQEVRDWEEFFVKETMAPYLTTSRDHFRE